MTEFVPYNPNQAAVDNNAELRAQYTQAYIEADRDQNMQDALDKTNPSFLSDVNPDAMRSVISDMGSDAQSTSYDSRTKLRAIQEVVAAHYAQNKDAIMGDAITATKREKPFMDLNLADNPDVAARVNETKL